MARTNETAWAVVMRDTGRICTNLGFQKAIYKFRQDAIDDCPNYAKVIRVRITEVKTK